MMMIIRQVGYATHSGRARDACFAAVEGWQKRTPGPKTAGEVVDLQVVASKRQITQHKDTYTISTQVIIQTNITSNTQQNL